MKKIILSICALAISIAAFSQTHLYLQNWPNGNKKIEGNYNSAVGITGNETKDELAQKMNNAIRIGKWMQWYENGQVATEEYYNNGTMTGIWKSWYADGKKQYEINFTSGTAVIYHANGLKQSEGKMLPGMLQDGFWIGYHENGNKNFEGSYKAGQKDGIWKWYNDKGVLYQTETFNNGTKVN